LVDICRGNLTLYLFADDSKMYYRIKDLADKDKLKFCSHFEKLLCNYV